MSLPIPPLTIEPAPDAPDRLPPPDLRASKTSPYPMELYRSTGVVRTEDDPYGAFLQFTRLFSSLRVRWKSDKPHNVVSSLNKRAKMLEWDPKALKVVENLTGITTTLPRRCPGACPRNPIKSANEESQGCPCAVLHGVDPSVWKGLICPAEAVKAYQHFIRYVRELEIDEADHVDIQQIMDIIQMHLIEDRCTENIHMAGLFEDKVSGILQKNGCPVYDRKASEAISLKSKCQKERSDTYRSLMTTRADREKLRSTRIREKQDDKKSDSVTNLAALFSGIRSSQEQSTIDATFKEMTHVQEDLDDFDTPGEEFEDEIGTDSTPQSS